jgi:pyruvate ferredoxin oxidoreductase, beta subunit (EC 1.2.7.1)
VFPLYEIDHGQFRVTFPVAKRKPVIEYLKLQGRFAHLTPAEIEEMQRLVDERVAEINRLAGKELIGPLAQ